MATAVLTRPVQAKAWIPPVLSIKSRMPTFVCVLCGRGWAIAGHLCTRCEGALS